MNDVLKVGIILVKTQGFNLKLFLDNLITEAVSISLILSRLIPQMVTALGKTWHPEHFVCIRCGVELGMGKFFERDDMPYCEEDYHAEFAPRCSHCNRPIVDVSN